MSYSMEQVRLLMVEAADRFILPRFNKLLNDDVRDKGKGEGLVTVADTEAEAFLSDALSKLDSSSCCVGEEAVADDPTLMDRLDDPLGDSRPVWVIDPVDGTRNFVKAGENFCVMIAKVQSDTIQQAWIYMPLTGECLMAEHGQGAFLYARDGTLIRQLKTRTWNGLDASYGRISFAYFNDEIRPLVRQKAERCVKFRQSLGSAGCEYALVAKGELDYATFNRLKVWDHAAGTLIVREAGGDCRMMTGQPYKPSDKTNGNIVGSSAAMNQALLDLLLNSQLSKKPADERTNV